LDHPVLQHADWRTALMYKLCLYRYIVLQIKAGYEVTKKIEELQVDGDLLLLLTERNLQHDLGVDNAITRKRCRYCYNSLLLL